MISKDDIDKVFEIAKVEEVVSDFVTLKKNGSNYKGLSPFTNEKTPSFIVSPSKQIWKDFSSGKGGNVVSFLMEMENYTYPEAIMYIARKYNIQITERELTPEQKKTRTEKESIYIIYEKVQNKLLDNLHSDVGKSVALSYFRNRGFRDDIIQKFGLGYSLDKYDYITKYLLKQGYTRDILQKSGISIIKNDTVYDRFRNRVTFPVYTFSGRIIAFGGRILSDNDKEAKYINSPETIIYNKSEVLYGLYQSKNEINRLDSCIILEGYTDVISFYQNGIKNVVSSSGTSLTKEQCRLIKRFTDNVTIIYDADQAGIKASLRGINILLEEGLNVSSLILPENEDPDSFARGKSSKELQDYISNNTTDFLTFIVDIRKRDIEQSPIKKAEVIKEIINSISIIGNPVVREIYIQKTSELLNISQENLFSQLSILTSVKRGKKLKNVNLNVEINQNKIDQISNSKTYKLEIDTLNILLNYGNVEIENTNTYTFILEELKKDEIKFDDIVNNNILDILYEYYLKENKILSSDDFLKNENRDIVNRVIDISFVNENLYDWNRKGIFVKNYIDNVQKESKDIVKKFKLNKIEGLLDKEMKILENLEDEEQINAKKNILNKLISLKNEILESL